MRDTADCSVRVLLDQLIEAECPSLQSTAKRLHPEVKFDTFDFLNAASAIGDAVGRAHPDIVLVDRVWLHLAPFLLQVLTHETHKPPRIVVASHHVDDVFRVQLVHRGLIDYIDLDWPADNLVLQLCEIHAGSRHHRDDLTWTTVPLPKVVANLDSTPRDDFDREILSLICVGMHDVDIAKVVHLSTQTVKNRISAMLDRSGLRNRTQLAWMQSNQAVGDAVSRSLRHRARRTDADYAVIE